MVLRILIVLAIVAIATIYLGGRSPTGEPVKPEVLYEQNTAPARALEQQMQEQAASQLEAIDRGADQQDRAE